MSGLLELYPVVKCSACGDDHYEHEIVEYNGSEYCQDCYKTMFFECINCGHVDKISENKTCPEGEKYCEDCFNELFFICHTCSDIHPKDIGYTHDSIVYCEECYHDIFRQCNDCGAMFHMNDVIIPSGYYDIYYCEECHSERYTACENCGSVREICDMYGDLCPACHEMENRAIRDYSYRPEPVFFGRSNENLHLGFEIEAENIKRDHKNNCIAEDINNELFYCKGDSSIHDGFEIVSHPMSLGYIQGKGKVKISSMLDHLRESGMRSYQTTTCGMHVHLSKSAIGNLTLFKMLKLFYENKTFILKFSNRTKGKFNEYSTLSDEDSYDKTHKEVRYEKAKRKYTDDRFLALNLENSHTIEIRIFRGTLNKNSFFRNLEFCHAIVQFCKQTSILDITVGELRKFVNKNKKTYPNLHKWFTSIKWTSRRNRGLVDG